MYNASRKLSSSFILITNEIGEIKHSVEKTKTDIYADKIIDALCERAEMNPEIFENLEEKVNIFDNSKKILGYATQDGTNRYIRFLESRIASSDDSQKEKYIKVLDALRN